MENLKIKIITLIISIFGQNFGKILSIFLLSMMPIVELRGSIPLGYSLGLYWYENLVISILGNILPVPFILFFSRKIFTFMKERNILKKYIEKIEKRALTKSEKMKNNEFIGLMLFVAIPFPGTGAWTGSLIATLLKMDIKKSLLCIILGVVIAGLIITGVFYGVLNNIFIFL